METPFSDSRQPTILLYTKFPDKRVRYAAEVVLHHILGVTGIWTTNASEFAQAIAPKIEYGSERIANGSVLIPRHKWLSEKQHMPGSILSQDRKKPLLFPTATSGADFPFDILAASFFLLTRMEEYHNDITDQHSRFPATESYQVRNDLSDIPLVDQWALQLRNLLAKKYPGHQWPQPDFRYLPTYDIDLPWKYLQRPLWRKLSGIARDALNGNLAAVSERLAVQAGRQADPFFTFDRITALHKKWNLPAHFFIPVGDYGPHDKNVDYRSKAYRNLIRRLATIGTIGLHPSYRSFSMPELLETEKKRLEQILGTEILKSRQHYLRFRLPQTYRTLHEAGIRQEYSMGFAQTTGFRSGTAHSFPWYDVIREEQTDLIIHPFAIMDVSLHSYLKLSPEEALERMKTIANTVRKSGGTLITIWHNNSLCGVDDWLGWDQMYEQWLSWISGHGSDKYQA